MYGLSRLLEKLRDTAMYKSSRPYLASYKLPRGVSAPFQRAVRGFTLVELMVVLTMVAILATLATPSLRRFAANQMVQNTAHELMLSMQEARGYAISRNRPVTIRANGDDWTTGWQIFVDTNGNGTLDAGEQVLSSSVAMDAKLKVQNLAGCTLRNSFTYQADGFLNGVANGGVYISTDIDGTKKRCVVVNRVGRPRIFEPA